MFSTISQSSALTITPCGLPLHLLELLYSKNRFNIAKYLSWGNSKWWQIKQMSFLLILVAEKCKKCQIYGRISDVYGERSFRENMFINGQDIEIPRRIWFEIQLMEWEHTDSPVKKNSGCSIQWKIQGRTWRDL